MNRAISLAALTVLELTPPDMVSCAAQAGYSHVGIRLVPATPTEPQYELVGDTPMAREITRRLHDTGVKVLDIEILRLKPETVVKNYLPVLEAGARLEASQVLIAGNDPDEDRLVQNFAALCELALPLGLHIQLEPMPWTDVKSVRHAAQIVERVGADNAGVLVDAIHWERSNGSVADIEAIPRHRFGYAQLCDAPMPRPDNMQEILFQARAERLFPGDGGIDLAGLVRALPADLPLSLEIPTQELAKTVNAVERARRALAATHRLLDRLGASRQGVK